MSFSSNDASSLCKSRVEDEDVGSRPTGCVCDFPIEEEWCFCLEFILFFGMKI